MDLILPEYKDVYKAHERIAPYIHRTPVLTSASINKLFNTEVFFKCENLQKAGAFKIRGATNAILMLDRDKAGRGVGTHSSGNHAAALSLAASSRGMDAYIVMPRTAPGIKKEAVKAYGGKITFCEPTLESREKTMEQVIRQTGAVYIPSYNHFDIIAGQGTAAKELIEDTGHLDVVMAPVGGGGLVSGTAISARELLPASAVIAVEPANADDAYRSFRSGEIVPSLHPDTIADGLLTSLGTMTFAIIREKVNDIVTVTEDNIIAAMRILWERMKIVVEPSGAVPFAAIVGNRIDCRGKRIGIILSGGNVDLGKLPF
jgi:threonine dehydratase